MINREIAQEVTADDIRFSDKFKGRKAKQPTERGWTKQSIADTINNPTKIAHSVNGTTGNSTTLYFCDDVHYVSVDDVTKKVVQVADLNDPNWIFTKFTD